jgi:hypothetical protein
MEDLDAKEDLSYQEHPVRIIETSERVTWNKRIKMCKVQWSHHTEDKAASAIASLREVMKAGPLCRQRTLDPKKISAMALNSTCPERGTSLIQYRGAVVMPRCSSKAQSLPVRIGDSAPKDSTLSASRYIFSGSVCRAGTLEAAAHSEVPADQRVDDRCSYVRYGGYEPSII